MTIGSTGGTTGEARYAPGGPLSNTLRNRLVAFGPIAVAILGIAIMTASGVGQRGPVLEASTGVDPVITGSVPGDPAR